jgi:CheY-like chemotaxis protein
LNCFSEIAHLTNKKPRLYRFGLKRSRHCGNDLCNKRQVGEMAGFKTTTVFSPATAFGDAVRCDGSLPSQGSIQGARIMIAEDELLIAITLEAALADSGAEVVGSFNTVDQAMSACGSVEMDAAIVDLQLMGELAFPLLRRLIAHAIPAVVVSGYPVSVLPSDLRHLPFREKPFRVSHIIATLAGMLPSRLPESVNPGQHEGLAIGF